MTRSLAAALLLCILSGGAWAKDGAPVIIGTAKGGSIPVIVQFRDAPMLARGRSLAPRFAAFERDLAAIDRDLSRRGVRTNSISAITARYEQVYAGAAVEVSGEAIARIQKLDYVEAVHLDRPMKALLEHSVPQIHAPEVWASFGTRGRDVVVAVIDTGVDYNHPALGGGFGPGHRVIGGFDFVHNDADPMDDHGHGTHVAGIVGGNGDGLVGVAPEVVFLAYKVLDENGVSRASTVLHGIERAIDPNGDGNSADHAHVVNLSLGGPGAPDDPLLQAVETGSAAGVVFCVAAGNDGDFQKIDVPGAAASAITVGASTIGDQLAEFSSKGPVIHSLAIKPEVVAPGVDIVSAQAGGGTVEHSGTSMATPHVAGVAALLRAIHPDWPVAHIKAAIVGTAIPLGNEAMAEGAGRVDALLAASADVIVTQSVINLGAADSSAHWLPSATITLVNRGTTARTLTLEAPSPRAGIGVTLDAPSMTLAPGASRDVRVSFDVDNALVPAPLEGSLAYSGAIQIAGGASPLHVPWAFVKGAAVTLNYDGNDAFEALLKSTTTTKVGHLVANFSVHRASTLLPVGTYDVEVFPISLGFGDPRQRVIVVEQQVLNGSVTIPVSRNAPVHEITPRAEDEKGARLETNRDCEAMLAVLGPQQISQSVTIVHSESSYLVSPLSSRFTLMPYERCVDRDHHRVYSAMFPAMIGLSSSQTPVVQANEWTPTPIRMKAPADAIRPRAVLYTGWLWHSSAAAAFDSIGFSDLMSGVWEGTLFLTPQRHPAMSASGKATLFRDLVQQQPSARTAVLESPKLQRIPEGVSTSQWLTTGPSFYVAQPGEPLAVGEGPLHPRVTVARGQSFGFITPYFEGAINDERIGEATGARMVLRNSAGTQFDIDAQPRPFLLDRTSSSSS